jgi:hypothetical protein
MLDNSKTKLTKIFNRLEEQKALITAERIKKIKLVNNQKVLDLYCCPHYVCFGIG